jgi:hypothetical protein
MHGGSTWADANDQIAIYELAPQIRNSRSEKVENLSVISWIVAAPVLQVNFHAGITLVDGIAQCLSGILVFESEE